MWSFVRIGFSVLRAGVAALVLFLCLRDWPAAQARAEFAALPDFDYAAEARALLAEERFAEALLVLETGLEQAPPAEAESLAALHGEVIEARDDVLRRLGEVGEGAWTGQGDSVESLAGALTADLLVFGDVRDLVIQGTRAARGEETDEVIVALSAAGIVLTVTPALDVGAALLKFARKVGALTDAFARQLSRLARRAVAERRIEPLARTLDDAASLGRSASPAAALRILRHVDDADELRLAAGFAERPGGAFALWLGGKSGIHWLKSGARGSEALLLRAARKGRAGVQWVADKGALLLRPHPLLGLAKGLYKGNLQELMWRLPAHFGQALLGLVIGWLAFELTLLAARLRRLKLQGAAVAAS